MGLADVAYGASPNRLFFELPADLVDVGSGDVVHYTTNLFAPSRIICFFRMHYIYWRRQGTVYSILAVANAPGICWITRSTCSGSTFRSFTTLILILVYINYQVDSRTYAAKIIFQDESQPCSSSVEQHNGCSSWKALSRMWGKWNGKVLQNYEFLLWLFECPFNFRASKKAQSHGGTIQTGWW